MALPPSNSTTNSNSVLGKRPLSEVVDCSMPLQAAKRQRQSQPRALQTLPYTPSVQSVQRGVLGSALNMHFRADVTFKIVDDDDDKEYEANRVFLAMVSPVFDRMLFGNMKESDPNEHVIINDITPETFECILSFAYAQNPRINTGNVVSVMKACDKYQISNLYQICHDFFRASLRTNFWEYFYEAMDSNIIHLVRQTLFDELNQHYKQFLNSKNFIDFLCAVKHRESQFKEFVDICYKFLEHQVQANDSGSENDFSKIFVSFCLQAMDDHAFDQKLTEISKQYFMKKFDKCLNCDNFCQFYIKATKSNISAFQEECKLFLYECDEAMTLNILNSNSFQEMNLENMKILLSLPWKCKEETLWERVVYWANYHAEQTAKTNNDEPKHANANLQKAEATEHRDRSFLLKSVRHLIRFGLMNAQFFAGRVQPEKVLTAEEALSVFTVLTAASPVKAEPRCICSIASVPPMSERICNVSFINGHDLIIEDADVIPPMTVEQHQCLNILDMDMKNCFTVQVVYNDTMMKDLIAEWSHYTQIDSQNLMIWLFTVRKNKTGRPNRHLVFKNDLPKSNITKYTTEQVNRHLIPTSPTLKVVGCIQERIGNLVERRRRFVLLDKTKIRAVAPVEEEGEQILIALKYFDIVNQRIYCVDWILCRTTNRVEHIAQYVERHLIPATKHSRFYLRELHSVTEEMQAFDQRDTQSSLSSKYAFYEEENSVNKQSIHELPYDKVINGCEFMDGDIFLFQLNPRHPMFDDSERPSRL